MANYHSIVRNWGEAESTFDTQLALGALEYKQQKYDANSSKIQETLNNYGNIGLLRDEEKKKLYNNLSQMVGTIEGVNGLDLSSNKITNTIMAEISKTIDEDLIKHHSLYKNKQKFDEEVEKARTEGKGRYSEKNEAYAIYRSGYEDYMRGDSQSFAPLKYIDQADLGEAAQRLQKGLNTYIEKITVKGIQNLGGEEFYRTKESKELTRQRILDFSQATLTDQEKQQIVIDGWAKYGRLPVEDLERDFQTYANSELVEIQTVIDQLDMEIASSYGDEKIQFQEARKQYVAKLNNDRSQYQTALESGDIDYMTSTLGFNDFNNRITRAFGIDRNEILRDELTVLPGSRTGSEAGKGKDSDPKKLGVGIQTTTIPLGESERDLYKEKTRQLGDNKQRFEELTISVYNSLTEDKKETLDRAVEDALGPNASQSEIDEMRALKMIDFSSGSKSFIGAKDAADLEMARIEYTRVNKELTEAREEALKTTTSEVYTELFSEGVDIGNFSVFLEGGVHSLKGVFEDRGIEEEADLYKPGNEDIRAAIAVELEMTDDSLVSPAGKAIIKYLQENIYDAVLGIGSTIGTSIKRRRSFSQGVTAAADNMKDRNERRQLEKEADKVERVAEIYQNLGGLSEDEAYEKAVEIYSTFGGRGASLEPKPVRGGLYSGGVNLVGLKGIQSDSKFEKEMRRILNERSGLLDRQQGIIVSPGSGVAYNELVNRVKSHNIDVRKDYPITIVEAPNGMIQARTMSRDDEEEEKVVEFLRSDVDQSLIDLINFNRSENMFTQENFPEDVEGEAIYTKDPDKIEGIADMLRMGSREGDREVERTISPETVRYEMLNLAGDYRAEIEERGAMLGEENLYSRTTELIRKIVSESSRKPLKVGVDKTTSRHRGTSNRLKIYYEEDGIEYKVFQDEDSIETNNLTEMWQRIRYYPQVAVNAMLSRLATGNLGIKEIERLEKYYSK